MTELADLAATLAELRDAMVAAETDRAEEIAAVPAARRSSAINLVHYLALRGRDERELQVRLADLGLSSLGRSEAHVAATIEAVQRALASMRGVPPPPARAATGIRDGASLLNTRADELLGAAPTRRVTRIMVTLPSAAADDGALVAAMVAAGMDCARINTTHDDAATWERMAAEVRQATSALGRSCRIIVDLAGPKLRTGAIQPGDDGRERIPVRRGDRVIITADQSPGVAARQSSSDAAALPARVPCTLPAVLAHVRPAEPIWFDDGMIGGIVEDASPSGISVVITRARTKGDYLRPQKGINLPKTTIDIPALGRDDLAVVPFAARVADLVGLSFAQAPADVRDLRGRLDTLGAFRTGIVLKVETARGFEALPEMLLAGMQGGAVGVMIARGDLAVEIGYERLAEVQEEILWLCEAAHVPSIWATQVLDTLAHEGRPTRAEVTDAAMGVRAECVMLNKGPEIVTTITVLDDILQRMARHHDKKTVLLRELRAWRGPAPGGSG
jgi:pyruvate kinase